MLKRRSWRKGRQTPHKSRRTNVEPFLSVNRHYRILINYDLIREERNQDLCFVFSKLEWEGLLLWSMVRKSRIFLRIHYQKYYGVMIIFSLSARSFKFPESPGISRDFSFNGIVSSRPVSGSWIQQIQVHSILYSFSETEGFTGTGWRAFVPHNTRRLNFPIFYGLLII